MGLPHCKNLYIFLFVSLICGGVWFLFSGLLTLCFLCFMSSVSFTGSYTKNEVKNAWEHWKELWSSQYDQPKPGSQRHYSYFNSNHHDIMASQTNQSRDYNYFQHAYHKEPHSIHSKVGWWFFTSQGVLHPVPHFSRNYHDPHGKTPLRNNTK